MLIRVKIVPVLIAYLIMEVKHFLMYYLLFSQCTSVYVNKYLMCNVFQLKHVHRENTVSTAGMNVSVHIMLSVIL